MVLYFLFGVVVLAAVLFELRARTAASKVIKGARAAAVQGNRQGGCEAVQNALRHAAHN